MIILYDHPLSPYAQKVKISLHEKGLAYQAPLPGGLGAGGQYKLLAVIVGSAAAKVAID